MNLYFSLLIDYFMVYNMTVSDTRQENEAFVGILLKEEEGKKKLLSNDRIRSK